MTISFEENHVSLFTFSLDLEVEMVNLRSVAQENVKDVKIQPIPKGTGVPSKDALQSTTSLVGHVLFSSNSC